MNLAEKFIFLCTVALFFSTTTYSQKETPVLPFDSLTNKITYSEVVLVDSMTSKIELYLRAREWFAKTYKSSKTVIQMEDKESGIIVGKALFQVYHRALGSDYQSGYINYTLSMYLKNGRYKYVISNFYHSGQGSSPGYGACEDMINTKDNVLGLSYQKTYNYYLYQLDITMKKLLSDLKSDMNLPAFNGQSDSW